MTTPIKALADMLANSAQPRRPGDGLRPFSKEWWNDMQEASNRLAAADMARDTARDAQEDFDSHEDSVQRYFATG